MKLARFTMSNELLAQAIRLPEGFHVQRIQQATNVHDAAEIVVEGPDFPDVSQGCAIPELRPSMEGTYGKDGIPAAVRWNWNLKPKEA